MAGKRNDLPEDYPNLIFDCVADGIFSVDRQMRITYFNRAAEEITELSREEALSRPCREVFRSESCAGLCPLLEAIQTGRPVVNRSYDILTRDDRKVSISLSASPLFDDHGRVAGGVQTFRDLSPHPAREGKITERYGFCGIVSRNPAMRRLFETLPDLAASDATVLITGESGTGKELFAQALHQLSPRKNGPLVVVNCGALPEPLLEAEIFGARRGAYTGASEDRPGRLETAQGGTLFLDEIGDLPLPLQVKLLRVLENHEFQPLGASSAKKADVRFLAATNCDLKAMVAEGTFRRDLLFRINVLSLNIPPLRERREDIPLLGNLFLGRFNRAFGKKIRGFNSEACHLVQAHPFPGNVRELLNLIEQSVIFCRGDEVGVEHLPAGFLEAARKQGDARGRHPSPAMLLELLTDFGGNRTRLARELGVDRTTLWRWLKRAGIA